MALPSDSRPSTAEEVHRRETLRYIVLPMVGVGLIVLAGAVISLLLPQRLQVSIIADWLLTILFLCPLALCLFPFCILMVAAVFGLNKAHDALVSPLRRVESLSETLRDRVSKTTDIVNQKTVDASAKWAFVDRLLSVFDPPRSPPDHMKKEE
jgi:hypothetical protein